MQFQMGAQQSGGAQDIPWCQHCQRTHPGQCRTITVACFVCGELGCRAAVCPHRALQQQYQPSPPIVSGNPYSISFSQVYINCFCIPRNRFRDCCLPRCCTHSCLFLSSMGGVNIARVANNSEVSKAGRPA